MDSALVIIVVHVNDCTIALSKRELIDELKMCIKEFVEITDMGELHWLLGIEVKRDWEARTILLSQCSYIDSIIHRFGFEDLKPITTPMDPNAKLSTAQNPSTGAQYAAMWNIPYREAVVMLMYAMLGTRPDISYAVTMVSKFSSNPGMAHWDVVKRIYHYLLGSKDLWLMYGGDTKVLVGYADADGSMAEDWCAVSGYTFIVDGGAVSWSTKCQEIVSLSTTESEYITTTHAAKEVLWLCSLIMQVFGPLTQATTLFLDNQSAIVLAKDHQYHPCTKHIDVRFYFIHWVVQDGKICLIFCPTDDMVADTLTKALPLPKVKHFASELRLHNAWGGVLEQQAPPARYLDICASLHWWLLMPLSTYALGKHVRTHYSISQPHDIILWLSIDFSTIISSWFLDYMILYFPFLLYLVMFISRPSDVVPHPSATSELSYLQIPLRSFCVSITGQDDSEAT